MEICIFQIKDRLIRYVFSIAMFAALNIGHAFGQEICNNGLDDDGDGYVDCYDSDCSTDPACAGSYIGQPTPDCQYIPPTGGFQVALKWGTNGTTNAMDNRQTPIVGDLDQDGIPEVIGRNPNNANQLYVFDGQSGALELTIASPATDVFFDSPALADLDNDGFGEIVIIAEGASGRQMYCYEHTGVQKWVSNVAVGYAANDDRWSTEIIDFNEDGNPEIYCGNQIYNGQTGVLIASAGSAAARGASPSSVNEALSVAGDVLPAAFCADCGGAELICGNTVYSVNIATGTLTPTVVSTTVSDGPTSLADIDMDGDLDAIVSGRTGANGVIYVWDLQTTALVGTPFIINNATAFSVSTAAGGRTNVGDFNNDGTPEIGLAGRNLYLVVDYDAPSNSLVEVWSRVTQDNSERTGSSVFDFEGDGANEVVYRDEDTLFVFDGSTGNVRLSLPCNAATRYDYPVVVDVDADGQTDILCACGSQILAFESSTNPWVKAREVWNQHAYNVVNINDDLSVPRTQQNPALGFPATGPVRFPFNAFLNQTTRLDVLGLPLYEAADDSIALRDPVVDIDYSFCQDGVNNTVGIAPTIYNNGDAPIPNGTPFALYNGDPMAGGSILIQTDSLAASIPAGDSLQIPFVYFPDQGGTFTLYIVINHDGTGTTPLTSFSGSHGECDTTNNIIAVNIFACGNNFPIVDTLGQPTDTVFFTVPENTANQLCLTGSDPDGDNFDITGLLSNPAIGSIAGLSDGDTCITYTTQLNQSGQQIFTVVVCDDANVSLCDTVVFVVNVFPVNDPPTALNDSVTTQEDNAVGISVLNNDSDPDNDPLVVTILNGPTNGTAAVVNGDSVVYTPNTNYFGPDSIVYVICDQGLSPQYCDTAIIYINVTPVFDPPVAIDDTVNVPNDSSSIFIPVTLNDIDIEGGAGLTAIVCGPNTGSASIVGDSILYVPDSSFIGLDSICYTYCDGAICDTGVVYINVLPANEFPIALDDNVTTTHNDVVNISVLNNDTDPDGDPMEVTATGCGPSNGVVSINADNTIDYTPNVGFLGQDTFCYVVCDIPPAGLPFCDTAFVYVNVVSDNIAPIGIFDLDTTTHNDSIDVAILSNDLDPDNTLPLFIAGITCGPNNGSASLDATGLLITYLPDSGFLGLDSICYAFCDNGFPSLCDTTTLYIQVISDNQAPIAVNDQETALPNTVISLNVLLNDSDPDNDNLTTTVIVPPTQGSLLQNAGDLTYTPTRGFLGVDSCQYEICDDGVPILCDSAWVFFEYNETGIDAPVGFTPNGDGDNDTWVVDGLTAFPNNTVEIFNRWGAVVFSTNDYQSDWDGNWNGEALPEGTYYWVINPGDGSNLIKGFVVLFR